MRTPQQMDETIDKMVDIFADHSAEMIKLGVTLVRVADSLRSLNLRQDLFDTKQDEFSLRLEAMAKTFDARLNTIEAKVLWQANAILDGINDAERKQSAQFDAVLQQLGMTHDAVTDLGDKVAKTNEVVAYVERVIRGEMSKRFHDNSLATNDKLIEMEKRLLEALKKKN